MQLGVEWLLECDTFASFLEIHVILKLRTISPRTKPALSVPSAFAAIAVLKIENRVTVSLCCCFGIIFKTFFLIELGSHLSTPKDKMLGGSGVGTSYFPVLAII